MNSPITIASFLTTLSELHDELDNAYWEANCVQHKDIIYNIINIIRIESIELNKLSIQDHHYPYEPITQEVRDLKEKLNAFRKGLEIYVPRSKTALSLEQVLPKFMAQGL